MRRRPGADEVVDRTTSDSSGNWGELLIPNNGNYYIKVLEKNFTDSDGTEVVCRGRKSRNVSFH